MFEGTNKSHLLAVTKISLLFTYKHLLELHYHRKCFNQEFKQETQPVPHILARTE